MLLLVGCASEPTAGQWVDVSGQGRSDEQLGMDKAACHYQVQTTASSRQALPMGPGNTIAGAGANMTNALMGAIFPYDRLYGSCMAAGGWRWQESPLVWTADLD
jgi:hypothetical protein